MTDKNVVKKELFQYGKDQFVRGIVVSPHGPNSVPGVLESHVLFIQYLDMAFSPIWQFVEKSKLIPLGKKVKWAPPSEWPTTWLYTKNMNSSGDRIPMYAVGTVERSGIGKSQVTFTQINDGGIPVMDSGVIRSMTLSEWSVKEFGFLITDQDVQR